MNFSLRPHQLVAHWVPGFVFAFSVATVICLLSNRSFEDLFRAGPLLLLSIAAFIAGQVIDAMRSCILEFSKRLQALTGKINFDFSCLYPVLSPRFRSWAVPYQHQPGPLRAGREVRVGHGRTLRGRPYCKPAGRARVLAGPPCHPYSAYGSNHI